MRNENDPNKHPSRNLTPEAAAHLVSSEVSLAAASELDQPGRVADSINAMRDTLAIFMPLESADQALHQGLKSVRVGEQQPAQEKADE